MEDNTVHADRLADLSAHSRARCMRELRRAHSQPLHALAGAIGLSRPALKTHLDALMSIGFVTQEEPRIGDKGGRPAATYSLNPHGATLCVVDISLHEHRFLLLDLAGTIHHAAIQETSPHLSPAERAHLVHSQLAEFVAQAQRSLDTITCFSATVGGRSAPPEAALLRLDHTPLIDHTLASLLPAPLILENDLKAAAYAEQRIGCARGKQDVIYALVWYQVAAGLILDGRLRRGVHDLAGEVNLVRSTSSGPQAHLTAWESWPAVLDLARRSETGEADARASIAEFCRRAAQQIAFLAMSIDPEMIVLGGPLVHRSPLILDEIHAALEKELPHSPAFATTLSTLPSWGPALGAALRGLETIETTTIGASSQEYHFSNAASIPLPLPSPSETTADAPPPAISSSQHSSARSAPTI